MEYLYYQTVIQVRIPIEEGKPGQPEVIKKFTTEIFAPKKKKSKQNSLVTEETEEETR